MQFRTGLTRAPRGELPDEELLREQAAFLASAAGAAATVRRVQRPATAADADTRRAAGGWGCASQGEGVQICGGARAAARGGGARRRAARYGRAAAPAAAGWGAHERRGDADRRARHQRVPGSTPCTPLRPPPHPAPAPHPPRAAEPTRAPRAESVISQPRAAVAGRCSDRAHDARARRQAPRPPARRARARTRARARARRGGGAGAGGQPPPPLVQSGHAASPTPY